MWVNESGPIGMATCAPCRAVDGDSETQEQEIDQRDSNRKV